MKRTLDDIRMNIDHVGCDNDIAIEMCDEIERLRSTIDRLQAAAKKAIGHAERNGMSEWPVFKNLRKALSV